VANVARFETGSAAALTVGHALPFRLSRLLASRAEASAAQFAIVKEHEPSVHD
jgi:hypothetical protein